MLLSIATLKETNAFTGKPEKVEIEWRGNTFECYVRPMSYQVAMGDIHAVNSGSDFWAARIASSICDKDGNAMFVPQDITGEQKYEGEGKKRVKVGEAHGGMCGELTNKLIAAIGKVQNAGKTAS